MLYIDTYFQHGSAPDEEDGRTAETGRVKQSTGSSRRSTGISFISLMEILYQCYYLMYTCTTTAYYLPTNSLCTFTLLKYIIIHYHRFIAYIYIYIYI